MPTRLRIVLDTNQLVRALARPPELATFVMAWASARFSVVCSDRLLDEYERVLRRDYVQALVYPELVRAFRHYLVDAIELFELHPFLPLCRDPDDDKVIATALQGSVDYLLTTDEDILTSDIRSLLARSGIRIATIDEFITQLDTDFTD